MVLIYIEDDNINKTELCVLGKYSSQKLDNQNDLHLQILDDEPKPITKIQLPEFNDSDLTSDLKSISNIWGLIISDLINEGNQFFSITINCKWDSFNFTLYKEKLGFEMDLIRHIIRDFPTINLMWFVYEKNKNDITHIHAVIAIKNFIDYNYVLKDNLKNLLIKSLRTVGFIATYRNYNVPDNFGEYNNTSEDYTDGWFVELSTPWETEDTYEGYHLYFDVKVDSLHYFKDVKNWIMYMHKDIKLWNKLGLDLGTNWHVSSLDVKAKFYGDGCRYGGIIDEYDQFMIGPVGPSIITSLLEFRDYIGKNEVIKNIQGIKLTNNKIDQRTLINILQYYLILNRYYIHNDNIYVKIKESKISYRCLGTIKEILYDNFQNNIVLYFIDNFSGYFKGFDFSYLMDNYFIKTKLIVESIKDISTQRIEPNFGLIEFIDGIYSIKYNRFFSNKENYIFSNKTSTIKYYNKLYNRVRQDKPKNWINGLKNALGIDKLEDETKNQNFVKLCMHIINPIHKDIFNKKSTLFIYGQSNTGKTTLIGNVLSDYYRPENIGSIINAKNFKWQDLIGKILGLIDEGRYNSSMSSDLLKITGQENIIVEKKYSKEHLIIKPIPLIILTNILFEDKDVLVDEALKNRLHIVEFINSVTKDNLKKSNMFKNTLKEEEVNIIIYCNKLLFSNLNNNLKKTGNKISNREILKSLQLL